MTTPATTSHQMCIRIKGELGADWRDYFGPLEMDWEPNGGSQQITVLRGMVVDQAAMIGVLNQIHDLNLNLISIEYKSS